MESTQSFGIDVILGDGDSPIWDYLFTDRFSGIFPVMQLVDKVGIPLR